MATPIGADTVTAIARHYIMDEIADGIYTSNVLWFRLVNANKKVVQGGTQIESPVQTSRPGVGGAYQGYEPLGTAPFDVLRNAAWDWKQYYIPVTVDGLTLIKTDSPMAIANFIKTQFELAKTEFNQILGADLYASTGVGADVKKLDGLRGVLGDTSSTYGGITRSSATTWWNGRIDANITSIATFTIANLQTMFGALTIGREHPTILIGRQALYNTFWSAVYGTSGANYDLQIPATGSDEILAQAGYTNLLFNNVPFVVDSQVDGTNNGKFYMLNENHWNLVVSPRADMYLEPFQTPVNQDAMTAKILWAGNPICTNPRLQGVAQNSATAGLA